MKTERGAHTYTDAASRSNIFYSDLKAKMYKEFNNPLLFYQTG
jgi:hypothetical protein